MLQRQNARLPLCASCFSALCSVPLRGWPTWERWGQHRSGQLEKLHLLLQAGQSCLSTNSLCDGAPSIRSPVRPVWPGMQSSNQADSTLEYIHSEQVTVWTLTPSSLCPEKREETQFLAASQEGRQGTVIWRKGLSALFTDATHRQQNREPVRQRNEYSVCNTSPLFHMPVWNG